MAHPTVLVTGGAGYIGSHTILEMLNAGYNVVCVDNLCNSYNAKGAKLPEALRRVQEITGKSIIFHRVDITDRDEVRAVFKKVIMFSFTYSNFKVSILIRNVFSVCA